SGTTAQASTVPASSSGAATAQTTYKDGTYTGQGTSRRGDVWVSVQVQGGRIANVSITRSTLQYPVRDIAGLPAEVVQRQSTQVDIVSRATYSSMAFRDAVTQALSAAHGS
ncbi:MAG: FMN-binding protein, partial [Chloroflexi bacterium]|nr:FMN-binding protein [Chloroflexota bacterium]